MSLAAIWYSSFQGLGAWSMWAPRLIGVVVAQTGAGHIRWEDTIGRPVSVQCTYCHNGTATSWMAVSRQQATRTTVKKLLLHFVSFWQLDNSRNPAALGMLTIGGKEVSGQSEKYSWIWIILVVKETYWPSKFALAPSGQREHECSGDGEACNGYLSSYWSEKDTGGYQENDPTAARSTPPRLSLYAL